MAQPEAPEFRTCRNSACSCIVLHGETYCSEHCENQARSAILGGHGCQCGHPDCTKDKPPAANVI